MRRRSAFTIIELLVVITVISILVSILLPVMNKVKQSGAQVSCMSNIKQLTAGILAYAAEHETQLPYCNWESSADDGSATYGYGWLFASPRFRTATAFPANPDVLGTWTNRPKEPTDGVVTGVIWPYVHSLTPYHCPIDNPDFYTGTESLTSYLFNGAECGYGALGNFWQNGDFSPGLSLRRIKAPDQSVVLWEAQEQFYEGQLNTGVSVIFNDGSSYPSEEVLSDRHYKGANISCYDGHVEWWDPGTWAHWVSQPVFSRLWCYPLTAAGR